MFFFSFEAIPYEGVFDMLYQRKKVEVAEVALYLYKSTYVHVWNTVVTSGLVPLVASWNC